METITFYLDMGNGKIYVANQPQVNLFNLLGKLRLKSVPSKTMYILQTTHAMVAGHYTISGTINVNSNGWQTTGTTFQVGNPAPPKLKLVDKTKNFLQPSREDKKKWRQISRSHSRNTGR